MLSNRVFPVLIVTAKRGKKSLVVVQIPVDVRNLSASFYSNGRNLNEGDSLIKRQKPVLGYYSCLHAKSLLHAAECDDSEYTSIESCRILPDGDIEWVMATASDAKGWLPMWAQKLGVPGAVVKDVGLFIRWIRSGLTMSRPDTGYPNDSSGTDTVPSWESGSA